MKLFLLLIWLPASMALAACDLSDRLTRQGEVIHDRLNHLEWQACSLGSQWQEGKGCVGTPALLTLLEAKDEAARLGEGWRLPTIEELFTLLDENCRMPMTDPNFFPDIHDNGENEPPTGPPAPLRRCRNWSITSTLCTDSSTAIPIVSLKPLGWCAPAPEQSHGA
ncbi:DUF1566 domain-containing protein [Aeromonas veronii]|uniref:Lcl C-terminal domain-containing protein n=1 Tax=Aeromonas veronii TaxID=654 RepID=UPI003B9ECAEA